MKPTRSLVIGSTGFLGSHFYKAIKKDFPDVMGTTRQILDLLSPKISFPLEGYRWAILAAGYATPQRCQADPQLCWRVDVDGVIKVCRELIRRGIVPVVLSTTQVFDGEEPLYFPASKTSPKNLYGKIHAERERILMEEFEDRCLVVRICRIYDEQQNIVREILDALVERGTVEAAIDQELLLMHVDEFLKSIFQLQADDCRGIYQICPNKAVTRYDLACFIADLLEMDASAVRPIHMADIDDIPRPKCACLASCCTVRMWKEGVRKVVSHYRKRVMGESQRAISRQEGQVGDRLVVELPQ